MRGGAVRQRRALWMMLAAAAASAATHRDATASILDDRRMKLMAWFFSRIALEAWIFSTSCAGSYQGAA